MRTRCVIAGALALGVVANAAPAHARLSPAKAQALEKSLGAKSAGIYYDRAKENMVVTVIDEASADKVRAQGGIARIVKRSGAKLGAVNALLRRKIKTPGTAWGIDPVENKVVLSFDASVDATESRKLREAVESEEDAIDIERIGGTLRPFASGGDAIFGGGSRCSLGFNVLRGGVQHLLTAGHCGKVIASWTLPATTVGFSFPGDDYAIVRYTGATPARPGNVSLYNGSFQEISSAANAYVGQAAKKSGSTTGVSSGSVTAINQTVYYAQGAVYGVIRTNICAQPGDSGGALFAGTVALGLVSGGSGSCSTGGTVYYQPVVEALQKYGATIY